MKIFHIPDMSCGHCKATVEKAIHALDPDARIDIRLGAPELKP
ncbi:heavy-metal-associated domain-containing protein [Roseovarius sp. M141]|nr:heavy-metal-associated domain-containing protein [Roseovarius sp. M141]MCQ0092986.1 heavy-metal-associated domain-containing protein [Roseovarius sp. M141]